MIFILAVLPVAEVLVIGASIFHRDRALWKLEILFTIDTEILWVYLEGTWPTINNLLFI